MYILIKSITFYLKALINLFYGNICYHKVLMSYIDYVDHLNEQLSSLKNSRRAFIGHVTSLIYKIHKAIQNLQNTEKVLFV